MHIICMHTLWMREDGWTQAREDWACIVDWGERKPRTDYAGVVSPVR